MFLLLFVRNFLLTFLALEKFQNSLLLRTESAFLHMKLVEVFLNLLATLRTHFFLGLLSLQNVLNQFLILETKVAKVNTSQFGCLVFTNDFTASRASLDSPLQSFAVFKMFLLIDYWVDLKTFFAFYCLGFAYLLMSHQLFFSVLMLTDFTLDYLVRTVLNMTLILLSLKLFQAMRTLSRLMTFFDMFFQS
jgi:hypothetical protein